MTRNVLFLNFFVQLFPLEFPLKGSWLIHVARPLSGPIWSRFEAENIKLANRIRERPWIVVRHSPKVSLAISFFRRICWNSSSPPNPDSSLYTFLSLFIRIHVYTEEHSSKFQYINSSSTSIVHNCPFFLLSPLCSLSITKPNLQKQRESPH